MSNNISEWENARKLGFESWSSKRYDENPYPISEDVNSLYIAWNVGWLEADNDSYESSAGYYL